MKNIFRLICGLSFIFSLLSCETTEKITVYGQPGTEIYTPDKEKVSLIESNGQAKVVLSSDVCYTYLLSKDANSKMFIPFALDYKNKSYAGTRMAKCLGYGVALCGLSSAIVGAALLSTGDGMGMLVGGLSAGVLGLGVAVPAAYRLNQTTREWRFAYLDKQQTNADINFTQPVFNEPEKQIVQSETPAKQIKDDNLEAMGWGKSQGKVVKLPFKEGTFDVLQVVTHFNGDNMLMTPSGTVSIKGNTIRIRIPENKLLKDKTIKITKDLRKTKEFGEPERPYKFYQTSDGLEVGLYIDNSLESVGLVEQKILITVNESVAFEIAWM